MNRLVLVVLFLSVEMSLCLEPAGTCTAFCTETDCITLNQNRVDFKTAEEACRGRNGELLTFRRENDEKILDILAEEMFGDLWIGLRLPAGTCSNLSAPLRGYEWISGSSHRSSSSPISNWKDNVKVCSPRCVSLSNTQNWAERMCSDKVDGFMCRTKRKDACQGSSNREVFIRSSEQCSSFPCQGDCTNAKGGFICSCSDGFIPDPKDPRMCKPHCTQEKCTAHCDINDQCSCPEGFIISGKFCLDMDECFMGYCDQECLNTFGSYKCYCREGLTLEKQFKCIKSPVTVNVVKPAASNNTMKETSAPTSGFLWVWIFIAVAVVVLIVVIRFCVIKRQKHREQISSEQRVDNIG
ncbi:uncharacterized protein V6R79_000990 [Siganus canaliculatus]